MTLGIKKFNWPIFSVLCVLRVLCVLVAQLLCSAQLAYTHDLERTQVALTFQRDGSFVLDVSNDPSWLKLRLESMPGPFTDRIVLWVDGREIRPESVELVHGDGVETHRMRGRMPMDARELRWYYGLVIDPYPMTIRRADGRIIVEEVRGDAWSRAVDLRGQFRADSRWPVFVVVGLLVLGLMLRLGPRMTKASPRRTQE